MVPQGILVHNLGNMDLDKETLGVKKFPYNSDSCVYVRAGRCASQTAMSCEKCTRTKGTAGN